MNPAHTAVREHRAVCDPAVALRRVTRCAQQQNTFQLSIISMFSLAACWSFCFMSLISWFLLSSSAFSDSTSCWFSLSSPPSFRRVSGLVSDPAAASLSTSCCEPASDPLSWAWSFSTSALRRLSSVSSCMMRLCSSTVVCWWEKNNMGGHCCWTTIRLKEERPYYCDRWSPSNRTTSFKRQDDLTEQKSGKMKSEEKPRESSRDRRRSDAFQRIISPHPDDGRRHTEGQFGSDTHETFILLFHYKWYEQDKRCWLWPSAVQGGGERTQVCLCWDTKDSPSCRRDAADRSIIHTRTERMNVVWAPVCFLPRHSKDLKLCEISKTGTRGDKILTCLETFWL